MSNPSSREGRELGIDSAPGCLGPSFWGRVFTVTRIGNSARKICTLSLVKPELYPA
jgi:hypothetical protein